ncbi:DnaJ domain-containing protein [Acinetobacter sp. SwsAc5]|uniref:DnaJ domain-containing protein n=1 Tax=Acinetobacter sp. SwsAc5 TaxID=2749438 RepID=UPI0015B88330|nr:DnaJ domain-containing protein [Acinetobacter sp. SwsAc5]NWK53205.1 DnaJ domain-containing protein [Acinetobacter sp. SwsAc5]
MNDFNPYAVLNVPDFSDITTVEQSYLKLLDQYQNLSKPSTKQAEQFNRIQDAYDMLSLPTEKELIDNNLKITKAHNLDIRIEHPDNLMDETLKDQHEDDVERELNTDKTMGVSKNKKMNPFVTVALAVSVFFAGSFIYGKLAQNEEVVAKNEVKPEPVVEAAPIRPALLMEDATQIRNNVLYPDPSYLQQKDIIYAPDGSPFPLEAMVLPNLPNSNDGPSTIIVQNPRETAIFGKTVVKYSSIASPIVNRYFYIPAKGTLHLFNMPSGSYQIMVMTLTTPNAYASPVFTIANATNQTVVQLADWKFAFQASSLF